MTHWYTGPWIWQATGPCVGWRPPCGTGGLDLRTLEQCGKRGGVPGLGIFFGPVPPTDLESRADYTHLGSGSFNEIRPTTRQRHAIPCRKGYGLQGDTLRQLIFDLLTHGADHAGIDAPRPIMPTTQGNMELHLGEQFSERLVWGRKYYDRMRQSLRGQFADLWEQNTRLARKCLGFWVGQYTPLGLPSWRDLIPRHLLAHVPGPLIPETTLTETFNTADSSTLGPVYTWTEYSNGSTADTWSVVSNQARCTSAGTEGATARAQSDLSSSNNDAQVTCTAIGSGSDNIQIGAACRFSSSAATCYIGRAIRAGLNHFQLEECSAGTLTGVGSPVSISLTTPFDIKVSADGSTIKGYRAGVEIISQTNTVISTGTRAGLFGYQSGVVYGELDSFTASDLAASVTPHLLSTLGVGG